jgi:hypothetical protein
MQNIKIHLFEGDKSKPEKTVIISVTRLEIAQKLMPTDIKALLKKEGIDINRLSNLSTRNTPKGTLIDVQTGKNRIVIDAE